MDLERKRTADLEKKRELNGKELEMRGKEIKEWKEKVSKLEIENRASRDLQMESKEGIKQMKTLNQKIEEMKGEMFQLREAEMDLQTRNQELGQEVQLSKDEKSQLEELAKKEKEVVQSAQNEGGILMEELKEENQDLLHENQNLKRNLKILSEAAIKFSESQKETETQMKEVKMALRNSEACRESSEVPRQVLELEESVQHWQEQYRTEMEISNSTKQDLNLARSQISDLNLQLDALVTLQEERDHVSAMSSLQTPEEIAVLSSLQELNCRYLVEQLSIERECSKTYVTSLNDLQSLYLSSIRELNSVQSSLETLQKDSRSHSSTLECCQEKLHSSEIQLENARKERMDAIKQRNELFDENKSYKETIERIEGEEKRLKERNSDLERNWRELEVNHGNALTREDAEREEKER